MRNRERGLSLFFAMLLVCALFTGCSAGKTETAELRAWNLEHVEPEYLTQWPENSLKIVPPQAGAVDYARDDTASGRYAIVFEDISSKESEQYVKELKDSGYAELHASANAVSVGAMLEGEDAYLSVSYAEGVLGVVITLKEAAKSA